MHVLQEEREVPLAEVARSWLANGTTRRIGPERLVVRASIVVARKPEKPRERQNDQRGRERQQRWPPARLRAEPCGLRVTKNLGRVKRRQIWPVGVVRVLERRPCRIDDESTEDDENDEGLQPPCVAPQCFTEASVKDRERCRHRICSRAEDNQLGNDKRRGKWTSDIAARQSRRGASRGGFPSAAGGTNANE